MSVFYYDRRRLKTTPDIEVAHMTCDYDAWYRAAPPPAGSCRTGCCRCTEVCAMLLGMCNMQRADYRGYQNRTTLALFGHEQLEPRIILVRSATPYPLLTSWFRDRECPSRC